MTRRGRDEGSIYRHGERDLWVGNVNLGWIDGKRRRKVVYGKTRKEVAEKLKLILREHQQGLAVATDKQTLQEYMERWLDEVVEARTRAKTIHSYREIARLHIYPTLGKVTLQRLSPDQVQRLLASKHRGGLSARTCQYIRAVLRMALGQAQKHGLLARNVAALVDPPRGEKRATVFLNPDQARQLLDGVRGDRLEALYRVALSLGLRRGEVLGLRWDDIDWAAATLRIERSIGVVDGLRHLGPPKTAAGLRTIHLPATLVDALRAHQQRQECERKAAGPRWQEQGYVFPGTTGTAIHPNNIVRRFHVALKHAGLPPMSFHGLRHSAASIMAAQGIMPGVAMRILGHSSVEITQGIYTHVFDASLRQAADTMDRAMGDEPDTEK